MGLFGNSNAPRRVLKRNDLAKRGVAALVVVAIALGYTWLRASGAFSDNPEVKTSLTNVGGSLAEGSDVKMNGALVGKVKSIDPSGGRVNVVLSFTKDGIENVPKNVQARVLPATVFGTSFVDLTLPAGAHRRGHLEANDTITEDKSKPTIELQQALDDIDALVKALGPAELASAIGSAAMALDGRGKSIGEAVELADDFLGRVNRRWPLFREDLSLLAENLEIVRANAPDLLDALDDGLVAAKTLVEKRAELATLLSGALALSQDANQFLIDQRVRFVRSIRLAAIVTDAIYDNRHAGLYDSFLSNMKFASRALPSVHGPQIYTRIPPVLGPKAYYTSADCPTYDGYGCGNTRTAGGDGR